MPVAIRKRFLRSVILGLALTPAWASGSSAAEVQAPASAPTRPLVVAVVDIPPFAIADPDGSWSGLGMDLWREIAAELDIEWEAKEVSPAEVHGLLRDGAVDAAIGAVLITAAGEQAHDYSQAYVTTGLGFVERSRRTLAWGAALDIFNDSDILQTGLWITLAVTFVGVLLALLERKQNAERFGGPLQRGIATGVWWAAAAMTTLGDEEATPRTRYGRLVAIVWMFVGVTAVAYFTATISALLTIGSLQGTVRHASDLYRMRLGAVVGSPGAEFLDMRHLRYTPFATHGEALAALADHRIEAALGPLPALRYAISRDWQGILHASSLILEPVSYAIGLPAGSPLQEDINRSLLRLVEEERWRDVETRYLGHH